MSVPLLIVTGPVGVGKTTVASEVSELLAEASEPHALLDIDALRSAYPSPPDDPFNLRLGMANLAAVWPNYRAAGARRLVVADVIESRDDLRPYYTAVPGAEILVVRLRAAVPTLQARVRRREAGTGREWHLHRAAELAGLMDERAVEDLLVETDGKEVAAVASDILERSGWL